MNHSRDLENVITSLEADIKQLRSIKKQLSASNKLESDYQESQLKFRTIFECSRFGNKILDSDLNILQVNPSLVAMLGYGSKKDLVGNGIMDFVPGDCQDSWRKLQKQLWEKSTPSFSLETCLIRKDGEIIWCQVTSILFLDHGKTLGYTIIEDVTEQRNMRLQKEEFISVASHELQTPLTILTAGLQLIGRSIRQEEGIS